MERNQLVKDLNKLQTDVAVGKKWGISRQRVKQLRDKFNIKKIYVDDIKKTKLIVWFKKKYKFE